MASLLNLQNNETVNLLAVHIVGRHPSSCNMVLENPKASRVHATITWDGTCWSLLDSSTNGTFVNGTRLMPNSNQVLHLKDKVHFANMDSGLWEVQDITAPKSMLVPQALGSPMIVLDNLVVLPNEESPQITLYPSLEGRWVCESDMGSSVLSDGNKVGAGGFIWRFVEATNSTETELMTVVEEVEGVIALNFVASQNEEHVSLSITLNKQQIDMGERSHHYLLLLLARQYIDDKTAGFSALECGWIEKGQLMQMLHLDEIHLNMQIYRFRKQTVKVLPDHPQLPQMVERRKGQVRFVCDHVTIEGGFQGP